MNNVVDRMLHVRYLQKLTLGTDFTEDNFEKTASLCMMMRCKRGLHGVFEILVLDI